MIITAQQAYNDIKAHILKQKGRYADWYCGVTSSLDDRLYGDHNVPKKNHWCVTRQCQTDDDARAVEKAMLDHGCDGGLGGGSDDAVWVYAYLKTDITDP